MTENDSEHAKRTFFSNRYFSRTFGYGLIDVGLLVSNAKKWTNVGQQRNCSFRGENVLTVNGGAKARSEISVGDCDGIGFLEHIQVTFGARLRRRGDLALALTSPLGTRTEILEARPYDYARGGFKGDE